jgi:signal transduction histidine kinase
VPGSGLGLSIAKLLVEAQGGRIDFESIPGRQTRFWIDLPLAA